jgi:protein tyrosine/serine phosphatase
MPGFLRFIFVTVILGLLIGVPVAHSWQVQSNYRNLHVVRPGVLVRSGQLSLDGLKTVLHDNDIRTVVTLRDSYEAGKPPPDLAEERFCAKADIKYVRIHPRAWWSEVGPAPVDAGVHTFLDVMHDPSNYPVLIHCWAGIHRTGAYCAIYRMEFEHWTNDEAIDELKKMGYDTLDDEWDILGYLEQYWPAWKGPKPEVTLPRRPSAKPGFEKKTKKRELD